jgi:PAS domain S-box-containing protein
MGLRTKIVIMLGLASLAAAGAGAAVGLFTPEAPREHGLIAAAATLAAAAVVFAGAWLALEVCCLADLSLLRERIQRLAMGLAPEPEAVTAPELAEVAANVDRIESSRSREIAMLRSALESSDAPLCQLDHRLRPVAVNREFQRLVAPSAFNPPGRKPASLTELLPDPARRALLEAVQRLDVQEPAAQFWIEPSSAGGPSASLTATASGCFDPDGRLHGVLVTLAPPLDEGRLEAGAAENRLDALLQALPEPACLLDTQLRVVTANPSFRKLVQPRAAESGAKCLKLICPQEDDCKHCPAAKAMDTGSVQEQEVQFTTDAGERISLLARAAPAGREGTSSGAALVLQDISRLKSQQADLREYDALLNLTPDPMRVVDRNGVYLWANQAYLDAVGLDRGELYGRHLMDVWGEQEWMERIKPGLEECLQGRELKEEAVFPFPGGEPRRFRVRHVPHRSPGSAGPEEVMHAAAVFRDVTERWRAERTAMKHSERLARMVDSISAILITLDEQDRVTHWNAAATRALGVSADEAASRSLLELDVSWPADALAEKLAECRQLNAAVRVESLPYRRADGDSGALGLTLNPIAGLEPGEGSVLILGTDITDIQARQLLMIQEQKMQSIGQLSAGIAHEISTPARFVSNNLRFLEEGFDDLLALLVAYEDLASRLRAGRDHGELLESIAGLAEEADVGYLIQEVPPALSQSLRGMERVSHILQTMKQFSHPGATEKRLVDVNQAVENTCLVTRGEWKHSSELSMDLEPGLPRILAMPVELNQALLNVVLNAAQANDEAMRRGQGRGEIRIATRLTSDLEHVEIRIEDAGPGVPHEDAAKIFTPFFTTKEPGQGTGQGLAITRSIVENQHGGAVRFDNLPTGGAAFTITLPLGRTLE